MTFEEAVEKSIRAYYEKMSFENYESSTGKPIKYTKDYFDEQEKDLVPTKMEVEEPEEMEEEEIDG